jgi:hypothetical protein
MSQKAFNQKQKDKKIVESLGMTYEEWTEKLAQIAFQMLRQEITMDEYKTQRKELGA